MTNLPQQGRPHRNEDRNEVLISGRTATDPVQHGKGPTRFRLVHGGGGKRPDGTPRPTQFFSISVWDKALIEGLSKGQRLEISGKLRDASYIGKDGVPRSATEITAESIRKEDEEASQAPLIPDPAGGGTEFARRLLSPPATTKNAHGVDITDEDIPF
jgi:single-stranded DNA-binding protein